MSEERESGPHLSRGEFGLLILALLGRRSPRERLYAATYTFLYCMAATVAGSWGMYWIHG